MGLALKIKEKITPDTFRSGGSHGGETNMHPRNKTRGASLTSSASSNDSSASGHSSIDKPQTFRVHRPRDSGIEIGHDSRFIEHVDVDGPHDPRQARAATIPPGTHTRDPPVSDHLPTRSRRPTAGERTAPGADAVGGGRYSDEPAAGPAAPRKVPAEGAGAFTSSKAGHALKPDYLTQEGAHPGGGKDQTTPSHSRENSSLSRPGLEHIRAYKSDAPLGTTRRSIVDGYGKDPSSPDSRLVTQRYQPETAVDFIRDYAPGFEAGGPRRTSRSGAAAASVCPANGDDGSGTAGRELRRGSSVERATVPYAGELDKLEDLDGGLHGGVGYRKGGGAPGMLSGVRDSGLGRGGIYNGVVGHGADR